jgi:EmrB/QacA subfamily drug resistance transporter
VTTGSSPARAGLGRVPYQHLVAVAFVFGVFMDILDTTVVNVALPTLAREFDAGDGTIEWVVTGYLLSLAVWIPASGWIGDRFGTKRTYLFALGMFTVASALCGMAWSIESLIGFRVLQGVGGGMLTPVGTAMLFRAYPPAERARAASVLAVPTVLAPALGPIIGGLIVTHASWRWIFYANLPIGVLGFVFTALFLEEHVEPTAGRFDKAGFALSASGLALVLYALSQSAGKGWTSAEVLGTGLAGLAAFALLVVVELRVAEPMLDLRLLHDRLFRTASAVSFAMLGSFLGLMFLMPLFLQELRGLSAQQSGFTTFPQALGVMFVARFVGGRLYPIVGPRRLLVLGLSILSLSNFLFVLIDLQTSLWWIRGLMFLRGWGIGFAFVPMQTITFASIRPADTGRASSLSSTIRQVGAAVGVASFATVLATRTPGAYSNVGESSPAAIAGRLHAFHDGFIAAAAFAAVGIILAWRVRDEDAAHTRAAPDPAEVSDQAAVNTAGDG